MKIPVIGLGGIQNPEDVLEYLIVGASAVQVGTAHFADPRASFRLLDKLYKLSIKSKVNNINELIGSLCEQKY